jgi:ubiquinone/menaquinone biosynthesis C-methylase UbiE
MTLQATMQQAFDQKTQNWLHYNQSTGGKLRRAVILHHLRRHIPQVPLDILDVGGGTGELAADLAEAGHSLTLLDFSPAMIEQARRRCAGLDVALVCADVDRIRVLFNAESFGLALCHSVLGFVDDPLALLGDVARVVRAGGLLSIVVGNRYHLPLRAALLEKNFHQAQFGLDYEIPATDLFGLPRRTFYPEDIRQMIQACNMCLVGEYGVRIFADLLGDVPEFTQDLLALELAASPRMPYCHLGRFVHFIVTKG